ncbi:MAG: hypothetical protein EON59_03680, partial [Alphaproteobacteria bacterium]
MIVNLPWLPVPDDAEREQFSQLAGADLAEWRTLLGRGWSESQLRRAGQRIRKHLADAPSADVAGAGLSSFKLLVLASHTFSHMADAIIASAVRHGVALQIELVEYSDPASWLANPANRADAFDGVLLAVDAKAWRIDVPDDGES